MEGDQEEAHLVTSEDEGQRPTEAAPAERIRMVLLAGLVLILAICAVAAVLLVFNVRSKVSARAYLEYVPCHFPELFEKPVFCFINFPIADFPNKFIPEGLCRHIVLCCQSSQDSTVTTEAVGEGILLHTHAPHAVRYLGFGGPRIDVSRVNRVLDSNRRHDLVNSIIDTMKDGEFTGGAAIVIDDWTAITHREEWNLLAWDLSTALEAKSDSYRVVLVLPRSAKVVRDLFPPATLMTKKIIPVMPSHLSAAEVSRLNYTSCSSPFRGASPFLPKASSLERTYTDLKMHFLDHWPTLRKTIVFTFSLAWTHFTLPDARNMSTGIAATFNGTVPYYAVCRYNKSAFARTFRDYQTDCTVMWLGHTDWYSGLGVGSSEFLLAHRDIRGIGLYDVHMDDFNKSCHNLKFSQLQWLHDAFRNL